jgi:hypothetical protein
MLSSPFVVVGPSLDDRAERREVDVVELVAPAAQAPEQARRLQHVEVLRDRLPGESEAMPCREAHAQFEECLAVALAQLVENRAPRRRNQGFENVAHE